MKLWLARDKKDDRLFLFVGSKPCKAFDEDVWVSKNHQYKELPKGMFLDVKWSDKEPTEVELVKKASIKIETKYSEQNSHISPALFMQLIHYDLTKLFNLLSNKN